MLPALFFSGEFFLSACFFLEGSLRPAIHPVSYFVDAGSSQCGACLPACHLVSLLSRLLAVPFLSLLASVNRATEAGFSARALLVARPLSHPCWFFSIYRCAWPDNAVRRSQRRNPRLTRTDALPCDAARPTLTCRHRCRLLSLLLPPRA